MKRLCKKHSFPKAIIDIKGTLMHMLFRGEDPDSVLDEDNKKINTAGFGFNNWLEEYFIRILDEHEFAPRQIIAVWDSGHSYRSAMCATYKEKGKKEYSETCTKQLEKLYHYTKSFLASLGVTQVMLEHQEADDVIAYLCQKLPEMKYVYTVDQDLLQLNNDSTLVFYRGHAKDTFKEHPSKFTTLYKSLVGDTSDNIQGVKGFGETAFDNLVADFGYDGLEEIEQCVKSGNFDMIESAFAQSGSKELKKIFEGRYGNAETGATGWQLSYKLASLAPQICERVTQGRAPNLVWFKRIPNREKFLDALKNLACSDRISEFEKYFGQVLLITKKNEHIVRDLIAAGDFAKAHAVSFDVESFDALKNPAFAEAKKGGGDYVDVLSQVLTGASFCWGDNFQDCIYVSVGHRDTDNCDKSLILDILKSCDSLIIQNASFEVQVIRQTFDDYILESPIDTAVMATMVDEDSETGLKDCSQRYLNYTQVSYKQVLELAREEEVQKLLDSHPEAQKIHEKINNLTASSLALEDEISGAPPEDKKELKTQIKNIKDEIARLRKEPEYQKVYDELVQIQTKDMDMSQLTGEQVLSYGADDAICAAHLFEFYDLILALENTRDFTYEYSFDPVHILNQSFEQGEDIDFPLLAQLAEEDAKVIADSDTIIRERLSQHCKYTNEIYAKEFFMADYQHYLTKWREGNKDATSDFIQFKQKQEIEELNAATSYKPIEQYKTPVEFVPTPKKLGDVCEALELPVIEKVTKSYLSDWAVPTPPGDMKKNRFVQLLLASLDEIKDRAGEHYDALKAFCEEVLMESQPWKTRGDELNFGSPKQMTELLYLKLGLPVRHRTPPQHGSFRRTNRLPGSPSTDEDCIKLAIAEDTVEGDWRREVLRAVLAAKAAITRGSYYYGPYPLWKHPRDGRIHGSIKFPSTATRRPTSSSPNLLQVTKKDGGKVRNAFRPTHPDSVCVCIDFSGQELRIAASESRDPVMLDAYLGENKKDIHSVTAASIAYIYLVQNRPDILKKFGLRAEAMVYETFMEFYRMEDKDVSEAFKMARTIAKTVNFLIIYGGSYIALAMQLAIPGDTAKLIMNQVMRSYARLEPWKQEVLEFARVYGYVVTAYGNRRHIGAALHSKDDGARGHAERTTINSVIQACAADILAVVLSTARKERLFSTTQAEVSTKANGVVPIYDEIKAYCPIASVWDYVVNMQRIMNLTPPGHAVPMVAEVSIGHTWGTLTELKSNPTQEEVMAACIKQEPGKLILLPPEKKVEAA